MLSGLFRPIGFGFGTQERFRTITSAYYRGADGTSPDLYALLPALRCAACACA